MSVKPVSKQVKTKMDSNLIRADLSPVFGFTAANVSVNVFTLFIKACKRVAGAFEAEEKKRIKAVAYFLTKSHSKQGRQPLLGIFGYFTKSTYQLIQE